ncbi:hypothetical protein CKO44_22740 [Rubrivivax gelatinosus]|uniref:DUF6404 family protein n=1 Tax=Rubrivivax gelatinosus TaxID=28068 RepID=UPI001907D884|nr:hypothetical protein [Rubrivivax gelatinosus]MBZ8143027.1 hypothetical protein [Rubrivivax gelatinosus]
MSDFEVRRETALRILKATGIPESNYRPPLLRLLWHLGFQVRPPHFAGFGATAAFAGTFSAIGWGALMWLLVWHNARWSPMAALGASAFGGACFGLLMSSYYARDRQKHRLPDWDSLGTTGLGQTPDTHRR